VEDEKADANNIVKDAEFNETIFNDIEKKSPQSKSDSISTKDIEDGKGKNINHKYDNFFSVYFNTLTQIEFKFNEMKSK